MVDVVITYVDSNDKHWIDTYDKCVKNELDNVKNRFRSYGVLDLQIKLIRKYMKFVDKIFVVVSSESQVPDSVRNLENVYIVLHSQIIPKRYLPCFNSCTIEMYLYNIKKLSERFIYFNDDIFPTNELNEEDFFVDGKIAIDFKEVEYEEEFANAFQKNVINSTRLFNKKANKFLKPAHSCFPAIKSHIIEVVSHNINEIQKSLTRTRHSKNINFYAFVNYEILHNNFVKKNIQNRYFSGCEDTSYIFLKSKEANIVCINDNYIDDYNFFRDEVRNILLSILNDSCFEKQDNTNKEKDYFPQYKKVIYTCITGNYDDLIDPIYVSPFFDYICFTDNKDIKSDIWKILPIPKDLLSLSKVKQQRNIKINTHKYLHEYDLSIWVDSSFRLLDNVNDFIKYLDFAKYNIFIPKHRERNCVYEEGKACIQQKKDNAEMINKELDFFRKHGMPENFGLVETGVIIKLHNDYDCIKLMREWSRYLNKFSHRDQLALPYCLFKEHYNKLFMLPRDTMNTNYFNLITGRHKTTNLCIVHYNTPELTNALIKSINKYVKRPKIWIFDNSDKYPFKYEYDNVIYLDNTKGQYIDFDKWLDNYPRRLLMKKQFFGSAKHSISIQKCIEIINENFILLDSDILIKKDISFMMSRKFMYIGLSEQQQNSSIYRVLPYICFMNVNMMKKYGVSYFDENYMHGLNITKEGNQYDTGANFYRVTREYPYLEINIWEYIVHFKGGSWEEMHNEKIQREMTSKEWLEINREYWISDSQDHSDNQSLPEHLS